MLYSSIVFLEIISLRLLCITVFIVHVISLPVGKVKVFRQFQDETILPDISLGHSVVRIRNYSSIKAIMVVAFVIQR